MKHLLVRRLLEWRIEIDCHWSFKPGFFGRGLEKDSDPGTWAQFEATYVGPEREDNWQALFGTIELFRHLAIDVARALGYQYPLAMDEQMMMYLGQIRDLDRLTAIE